MLLTLTTPIDYSLEVAMVSGANWIEGTGLDMSTRSGVCNGCPLLTGHLAGLPRIDDGQIKFWRILFYRQR